MQSSEAVLPLFALKAMDSVTKSEQMYFLYLKYKYHYYLVVHANWESTNEEGYTYIRLKMSKEGILKEYIQFTEKSLMEITELIITTRFKLEEYW